MRDKEKIKEVTAEFPDGEKITMTPKKLIPENHPNIIWVDVKVSCEKDGKEVVFETRIPDYLFKQLLD